MSNPKWCMCMVCGDVIYAGPGFHPIPRECGCKATRVVPTLERGFVQWDRQMYKDAAIREGERVLARVTMEAVRRAAAEAVSFGYEEGSNEYKQAVHEAKQAVAQRAKEITDAEIGSFPTEPEIEYAAEGEQLYAHEPVAPPSTITQIYQKHWQDVEAGKDV